MNIKAEGLNILEGLAILLTITNIFSITDVAWGWIVVLAVVGFTALVD